MPSWSTVEEQAPDLAARARGLLDANKHKTLATLRRDGSPRISGVELAFKPDGEVYFGSMWMGVKALDLRRDPRFALHSASPDPDEGWDGDAKFAGVAVEITDPDELARIGSGGPGRSHLFRLDIRELVVVSVNPKRTKLLIDSWHDGRGVSRIER